MPAASVASTSYAIEYLTCIPGGIYSAIAAVAVFALTIFDNTELLFLTGVNGFPFKPLMFLTTLPVKATSSIILI